MNESRREFLARLVGKNKDREAGVESSIPETNLVEKEAAPKSRRLFLVMMAEALGITISDALLDNVPSRLIRKYLLDADFRNLVSSRSPQQLATDFQEIIESRDDHADGIEAAGNLQLEKASDQLKENWMDQLFDTTTIFRILDPEKKFQRDQFIAVAEINHALVLENHQENSIFNNSSYSFATIPSSARLEGTDEPALYAAFTTESGVQEFSDQYGLTKGGRSLKRGALIIDNDSRPKIVNSDDAQNYIAGQNCLAIESAAYCLDSSQPQDIADFNREQTESLKLLSTSRTYTTCSCTYYFPNQTFKTFIFTAYQKADLENKNIIGAGGGSNKFTPVELFSFCEKFSTSLPSQPEKWVMQLPDPADESVVKTNIPLSAEKIAELGDQAVHFTDSNGQPQLRLLGAEKPFGSIKTKKFVLAATRSSLTE